MPRLSGGGSTLSLTPVAVQVFFSSRRRHTRLQGDWSSDVCSSDLVVQAEGRTMKGLAAIQRWKTETKQKYHHTVEPLAAVQKDGKTVVTGRLTGEFPGSPVE